MTNFFQNMIRALTYEREPYKPLGFTGDTEDITPQRYLEIMSEDSGSIDSAEVIPPVIGVDDHFGKIRVKYLYRALNSQSKKRAS